MATETNEIVCIGIVGVSITSIVSNVRMVWHCESLFLLHVGLHRYRKGGLRHKGTHRILRPYLQSTSNALSTNSACASADLLFLRAADSGKRKKVNLYPSSMTLKLKEDAPMPLQKCKFLHKFPLI